MKRLLLIPILFLGFVSTGQVLMTGAGSYSQDFNTLLTTGTAAWTDNSTLANWFGQRAGTGTNILAGDGSSNTGGIYSFGTGTSSDRAFGDIGSGTPSHIALGVEFQNTSGVSLTNFTVSYTMEQWRNGGNTAAQTLTFWYKTSSSPITALTPNTSTGWTAVTLLDGTSLINTATAAALDGNLPANQVTLSNIVIPGLTIANGDYLMLKWDDPNNAGNDHGLSVDNFSASWTTSCNTTSSINVSACSSYTVPSGDEVHNTSGIYHDTIPNAAMCDSIITINLTITGGTTSSFSVSSCTSYMVPSGDETYFVDGVYMDTIPNHLGCDSVMTITVDIVTGITYYQDFDTDGLGNASVSTVACVQPGGYVTNSNDCNDNNNMIGAATTWYLDADMDGYGSSSSIVTCTPPSNYVSNNTDCNDANSNVHPGGTEIPNDGIDQDCSGGDLVIVPTPLAMYEFTGNDCSEANVNVTAQPTNATFGPYSSTLGTLTCSAAANVFNHSAWNMTADVVTDEYYSFSVTPASCYEMDLTELHFTHKNSASGGNPTIHVRSSLDAFASDIATVTLAAPNVYQTENITLPSQFLGLTDAIEFRFYVTSMATGTATYRHDDVSVVGLLTALSTQTYYADTDGDTYGDPAVGITSCVQPVGYVLDDSDCDDTDENAYPGAVWAIDNDADGYAGATTMVSCTQPANHIPASSPVDCDDNNNAVTGETTYYADTDNDGYGDANNFVSDCSQPGGFVTNDDDCDDSDNSVGLPSFTYYMDLDGDMYGDPNSPVMGCAIQVGLSPNNLDCDDNDSSINPDAVEICDDIDNNCDGNIDEGLLNVAYYEDADGDGFGNSNSMVSDCTQPTGYVTVGGDCNDADDQIFPTATDDFGDAIDQNCDGVDGYLSVAEDVFFEISASPNPGNTFVMVSVSENFGITTAEMISADGRVVNVPFSTVEGGVEIQTLSLVPGMYIIRLFNGYSYTTVRWIKL